MAGNLRRCERRLEREQAIPARLREHVRGGGGEVGALRPSAHRLRDFGVDAPRLVARRPTSRRAGQLVGRAAWPRTQQRPVRDGKKQIALCRAGPDLDPRHRLRLGRRERFRLLRSDVADAHREALPVRIPLHRRRLEVVRVDFERWLRRRAHLVGALHHRSPFVAEKEATRSDPRQLRSAGRERVQVVDLHRIAWLEPGQRHAFLLGDGFRLERASVALDGA